VSEIGSESGNLWIEIGRGTGNEIAIESGSGIFIVDDKFD